jgi:RNA polymerase sigma-70 factor (ECF subfamily)
MADPLETFVERVTGAQQGLFAYILALVPSVNDANDVLQETNLILWRNREEFRAGEPFWPWARTIAHYQVLAHLKRRGRDRLRFGDTLIARLAEETAAAEQQTADAEQAALGRCIEELPASRRELVELRYANNMEIAEIARRTNRSYGAVADALYRARGQLGDCIREKLSAGRDGQ